MTISDDTGEDVSNDLRILQPTSLPPSKLDLLGLESRIRHTWSIAVNSQESAFV